MLRSLRARLMLVSAGLSGAVLAVFAGWTYARLYDAGMKEIDSQLRDVGQRFLLQPPRPESWSDLDRSLAMLSRSDESRGHLMLVKGRGGEVIALSSYWPPDLKQEQFSAPALDPRDPGGPPPRPAPRPGEPPRGDWPGGNREFGGPPPPPGQMREPFPDDDERRRERDARDRPPGPPMQNPPALKILSTLHLADATWRIAEMDTPRATLVVGIRLDGFQREMSTIRTAFLGASVLALLGIVLGAWAVSNQALAPMRRLSRAIAGVSAHGLDQRVPEETSDAELRQLTQQFNAMMARLETSFIQAVRFSADAAHELKTPLAILQGHLEEALRNEPAGSAGQQAYSKLLEEVQRLKAIVSKLLLLSRADAGRLNLSLVPVNLSEVVSEMCEDTCILAPSLDISADVEPMVMIGADEALLGQVLQNMCSNAIKYNLNGGKIRFLLRRSEGAAVFSLWNTGAPIPEADRDRIFDRFYRVDSARTRSVGGAGLGLSLAREIARAHGGDLTLEPQKDGWIGFRLSFPLHRE